ncbi:uncharacterized protein ACA1_071500 [Acanthamoeba castellanii str. Neff]|uniref:Uncharacterized protein n=1 Tax=Acanthamoeba castellanii (strain ATCC 30010 / Neff) TaxID=1257118 RepID=L8HFL8_ACACF|nr:uncharacterized protein ACA1_071500 [Acanthamoeba castellanii str. Neff]ELR23528.1 hypothetical protein ACA1_071500 [Acanthamoeba castellanii str. Neff]
METLVEWEGLQSLTLRDCTFPDSAAGLGPCLFSTLLYKLVLGRNEQSAGYPTTYCVHKSILESVAGLTQLEELRLCNRDELNGDVLARILQFENLRYKLDLSLSPLWSLGSIEKPNASLVDCLPDDFASLGAALPSVVTTATEDTVSRLLSTMPNVEQVTLKPPQGNRHMLT